MLPRLVMTICGRIANCRESNMHHVRRACAHAARIHDLVQLGAGMLACIALLIYMALSGRDADDPVIRMMADVGTVMAQAELPTAESVIAVRTQASPAAVDFAGSAAR